MTSPLLSLSHPIAFDRIRPDHVLSAVALLIASARARIDSIGERSDGFGYANTLQALDEATEPLEVTMGLVEHLDAVMSGPELRAAHDAVIGPVTAFSTSIPLHAGVWRAVRSFAGTEEAAALEPTRRRFLERTVDEFRRHGAELDASGKQRLQALDQELSQHCTRFAHNVLDATNAFDIVIDDPSRLGGLPASALDAARHSARTKGMEGWRFTLHAPSLTPVLTHADDRALREWMWSANNTRGAGEPYDNRALVARILTLRREKAQLLGYPHFADLVLEPRMARTGEEARKFVEDLTERSRGAFDRENAELLEFRRAVEGPRAPVLEPWDVAYYAEKLRKARYDFDEEQLRDYFPFEQTLQGLFRLCERLFDIQIEPAPGIPVWHESVRAYRLRAAPRSDDILLYVDPFPRESKRPGAWMHGLVAAERARPAVAALVTNATPPTDRRPSLLTHREVETLFHEFGHLLHHCLSRVEVRSLSGTHVPLDFVELPSQIMENWCWEREALDTFARHASTGALIPDELLGKLRQVRTFRAANQQMRQLGFAAADLALHMDFDPAQDGDPIALSRRVLAEYSPAPLPDDHAMFASFNHLFARPVGYAAGYYSYKWAEVLDADAFTRFASEGLLDREVGLAWRREVLERGDSRPPMQLFEAFMGRQPRLEALLGRQGLLFR
ncbi:MAG: M3 family metallopeptidase [Polyangiaceae bacterium]|nr:M3 family metallopeptidase [Polyangiaceae bacterium]